MRGEDVTGESFATLTCIMLVDDHPDFRDLMVALLEAQTDLEVVAQAAWDAVHGKRLHTLVGKTARRIALATKWYPALVRKRGRKLMRDD